ncbi:uncharacterized [Tachysurus ichikawai]
MCPAAWREHRDVFTPLRLSPMRWRGYLSRQKGKDADGMPDVWHDAGFPHRLPKNKSPFPPPFPSVVSSWTSVIATSSATAVVGRAL